MCGGVPCGHDRLQWTDRRRPSRLATSVALPSLGPPRRSLVAVWAAFNRRPPCSGRAWRSPALRDGASRRDAPLVGRWFSGGCGRRTRPCWALALDTASGAPLLGPSSTVRLRPIPSSQAGAAATAAACRAITSTARRCSRSGAHAAHRRVHLRLRTSSSRSGARGSAGDPARNGERGWRRAGAAVGAWWAQREAGRAASVVMASGRIFPKSRLLDRGPSSGCSSPGGSGAGPSRARASPCRC